MRYTVSITGQVDTNHGADAIRRDASWILSERVAGIVPGTVEVTSVEPVAVEPARPDADAPVTHGELAQLIEDIRSGRFVI